MQEVRTDNAPAPLGPYSQGIIDGDTVYVSGQGPANPETREVEVEAIDAQTEQTLENVAAILEAADSSIENVVRATVYVTDMDNYDAVNEVYAEHMTEPYPSRTCVEVAELPAPIGVEIDVIGKR
ncbi:MAG: Rid family detoxifying hydrolase [Halobacteriales archaeon]|nr:Rid family detoxifying hydrolase [Halobacteriales archaeon]